MKWYNEAHLAKGKSVFLEQMKKFVEWLKNAEEGKHVSLLLLSFSSLCSWFCQKHGRGLCFISFVLHAYCASLALTDVSFLSRVRVRGRGGRLRTCSYNYHVDLYFYINNSTRCKKRKICYASLS